MFDETATLLSVARNVRAVRNHRGWSLQALADRAGLSKTLLIHIEKARTNLTVATLCRLADALGMQLTEIVAETVAHQATIVSHKDQPVLWRGPSGGEGRLVSSVRGPDGNAELWEWTLHAGETREGYAESTSVPLVVYLTGGTLSLNLDGHDLDLQPGDTITLDAGKPHTFRNKEQKPAHFYTVAIVASWPSRKENTALDPADELFPGFVPRDQASRNLVAAARPSPGTA